MKRRVLVSLFVCVFLQACISSDTLKPTTYYVLEDSALAYQWEAGNDVMGVSIQSLPSYLQQRSLVMLEDKHQLYIAHYHQWASDLRASIRHILLYELNRESEAFNFVQTCRQCPSLQVNIDTFYATEAGEVLLSGYAVVSEGASQTERKSFSITTNLQSEGYVGAVSAMREALRLLAIELQV